MQPTVILVRRTCLVIHSPSQSFGRLTLSFTNLCVTPTPTSRNPIFQGLKRLFPGPNWAKVWKIRTLKTTSICRSSSKSPTPSTPFRLFVKLCPPSLNASTPSTFKKPWNCALKFGIYVADFKICRWVFGFIFMYLFDLKDKKCMNIQHWLGLLTLRQLLAHLHCFMPARF